VQLAGWEEMLLALAGLVLLAVEVFVIPGFGVAGALGIAACWARWC
jgi:membrane-bound serine protease (ClpP class)